MSGDEPKVFVADSGGPEEYIGFFEDDGETGLYVSDGRTKEIVSNAILDASWLKGFDELHPPRNSSSPTASVSGSVVCPLDVPVLSQRIVIHRGDEVEGHWELDVVEIDIGCEAGMWSRDVDDLVGTWTSDPEDHDGIDQFGRVTLEIDSDGSLTYTLHMPATDQKMFLTYRKDDQCIVTNQPTSPREERTRYEVAHDGKLILWFQGHRAVFVRTD